MKRTITALAVGGVLLLGCGGADKEGTGDASVSQRHVDDTPANVVNMPDGWSNVAWKCAGRNGVYTVRGNDAPAFVVREDPNCGGTR